MNGSLISFAYLILNLLVLSACASQSASKTELSELRAEVRALKEHNARLQLRLDQLEGRQGVEIPSLTVIKLKPRTEPIPPVDLNVPVREPPEEMAREWNR